MPKFIASAPGRCGIVGNPSDIYGGYVVSCSVPARARCVLEPSGDGPALEDPKLWLAATSRFPLQGGARVVWESTVPRSSGLAGSTALLAATLACVLSARSEMPALESVEDRSRFAELVRDVEAVEAGVVCGYQDAQMVVHGGMQAMDFEGKHPLEPGPLPRLATLRTNLRFLLVTTGVERLSGSVHGPMRDRWLAGERQVVQAMARIAELGRWGAQALVSGDSEALAEAMSENQRLVADLGGSGDAIDALIATAVSEGAQAAKLAGAGMGGTVIALTDDPDGLRMRLQARGYTRFLVPLPSDGLRIDTEPN